MNKPKLALAVSCLAAALLLALGPSPLHALKTAAPKGPPVLPSIRLEDLQGQARDSAAWSGKILILDFWATWCTACRQSMPQLMRLQDKYGPRGLKVVGISLDTGPKSTVERFLRKHKVNYLILRDPDDTLSKTFGFQGLPSLYIYGRKGELIRAMPEYSAAQENELEDAVADLFPGP